MTMEALCFSKTLAVFCQTARFALEKGAACFPERVQNLYQIKCHTSQDIIFHCYHQEIVTSYVLFPVLCSGPDREPAERL